MGSVLRRAVLALVAACVLALAAGPAYAAPPVNDSPAGAIDINQTGGGFVGARQAAPIAPEDRTGLGLDVTEASSNTAEDVELLPGEASSCNTPSRGNYTVYFRLGTFSDRTAITIDTLGSTYANAVAVFAGPPAVETLRHCERENLAGGAASVSFVTSTGVDYFVEVAATNGPGRLKLFVRATDIQPPRVSIATTSLRPDLGGRSIFSPAENTPRDEGSDLADPSIRPPVWTVDFAVDGGGTRQPRIASRLEDGGIEVTWPDGTRMIGRATVRLRVWDRAGNEGSATLTVTVRDREPPRVRSGLRLNERRRQVWARVRCTEAGRALVVLRSSRGNMAHPPIKLPAGKWRNARFPNVRPGVYIVTYQCIDMAGNASERTATPFLFRL
jgi:hypothetical protein